MSAILPLLLALSLPALTVEEVPNPRTRNTWVADEGNVIQPDDARALDELINNVERATGVEIAVVTVPDTPDTPKEFAVALFQRWGIGKAKADNGVLVLLVLGKRRLEMEVGYGLEPVLPDGWLLSMQKEHMTPEFKAGRFGAGMVAGVKQLTARIMERADEAREGSRRVGATPRRVPGPMPGVVRVALFASLGAAVLALTLLVVAIRRKRSRKCHKCGFKTRVLPEDKEDKFLSKGQQKEESLGSILYDVLFCDRCGAHRVVAHNQHSSRFSRCPKCNLKTAESTSRTLVEPTYHSDGSVEVSTHCRNCNHHTSHVRSTARLVAVSDTSSSWSSSSSDSSSSWSSSDSSSSSSGSDFGGGSSGGGGAGSDY